MSDKFSVKTTQGKEIEYRILFDIKTDNKNYIIYTSDEKDKNNNIKAYSASYKLNKKTKKYTMSSIISDSENKFIEKILNSIQKESEI